MLGTIQVDASDILQLIQYVIIFGIIGYLSKTIHNQNEKIKKLETTIHTLTVGENETMKPITNWVKFDRQ